MEFRGSGKSVSEDSGRVLYREQKKLEKMVREVLEKGDTNLGNNEDIIKQSLEVDKLIVDNMLQREMEKDDNNISKIEAVCKESLITDNIIAHEAVSKELKVYDIVDK